MGLGFLTTLSSPLKIPMFNMERSLVCVHALASLEGANKNPLINEKGLTWNWISDNDWNDLVRLGTSYPIDKFYNLVNHILNHSRQKFFVEVSTSGFWTTYWKNKGGGLKLADKINRYYKSFEFSLNVLPFLTLKEISTIKTSDQTVFTHPSKLLKGFESFYFNHLDTAKQFDYLKSLRNHGDAISRHTFHRLLKSMKNVGNYPQINLDTTQFSFDVAKELYPTLNYHEYKNVSRFIKTQEDLSRLVVKTHMDQRQALQVLNLNLKFHGLPKDWSNFKRTHKLHWILQSFENNSVPLELLKAMVKEGLFLNTGWIVRFINENSDKEKIAYLFLLLNRSINKTEEEAHYINVTTEKIPSMFLGLALKIHTNRLKSFSNESAHRNNSGTVLPYEKLLKERITKIKARIKLENQFRGKTKLRVIFL